MNYHNITKDDMLNGDGVRVVLWVAGCSHNCKQCQNPDTWNPNGGISFDSAAKEELFAELNKDYLSGITFSGGDPMHESNRDTILELVKEVRNLFPEKTIWLYTGYTLKELQCIPTCREILKYLDVLVDGPFNFEQRNIALPWRGSENQNIYQKEELICY